MAEPAHFFFFKLWLFAWKTYWANIKKHKKNIKSHFWKRGKKKNLHDESLSVNLTRAWPLTRLCHYDNATHRTGKPHAIHIWGPEKRGLATAATSNRLSNSKTWHRIRSPASVTGCHNVQICIVTCTGWALFLDPGDLPLIKCKTQPRCLPEYVQLMQSLRWFTVLTLIETFPSGENGSVAFFLFTVGRNKQLQELAPFTKERRAVFGVLVVKKRKGPFSTQLYSQWVSDGNDSP